MQDDTSRPSEAGRVFNHLTTTGRLVHVAQRWLEECRCTCGTIVLRRPGSLRDGSAQTCGCGVLEALRKSVTTHGALRERQQPPEYKVWSNMLQRCTNPLSPRYADYGGRGITVCERWTSFENFFEDMGRRPSATHSIDRKDNDGPYSPENCQWADDVQQGKNRRSNVRLTAHGETMTIAEWARRTGLARQTIEKRIARGWSAEAVVDAAPSRVALAQRTPPARLARARRRWASESRRAAAGPST